MKFERFQQLVRTMFLPDGDGNPAVRYDHVDAAQVHPLVLAYIGDAYFHLYVRMRLLSYEQAPRSASVADYHASTGFEALLGSLYIRHETERLEEITEAAFQIIAKAMMEEMQGEKKYGN